MIQKSTAKIVLKYQKSSKYLKNDLELAKIEQDKNFIRDLSGILFKSGNYSNAQIPSFFYQKTRKTRKNTIL